MSDDFDSEGAAPDMPDMPSLLIQEPEGPALRWTPTCLLIDLLDAVAAIVGGIADFFENQGRSLAARASLKEELKDHAIRQRLRTEERERMHRNMLEDIAALPEVQE